MSPDKDHLAKTIQQLQSDLTQAKDVPVEIRRQLETAARDLQQWVESQKGANKKEATSKTTPPGGWGDQLLEAARDFEESHPTLSATLNSLADALSRLGI